MPTKLPAAVFSLRSMTPADITAAHRLSIAVGWPHRAQDWQFVLGVGRGVAAVIDNRVVGTALWWDFDGRIARVGMAIVDPAVQKSGIGKALMQAALDAITAPTVILNATAAGQSLYERLGFVRTGSIMQYQGVPAVVPTVGLPDGMSVRPALASDRSGIIALDAEAGGVRRDEVIGDLLQSAEAVIAETAGSLSGFAICRRFGRGDVVGPIVAGDAATAKALFAHWVEAKPGCFLRADVPEEVGLGGWLEGLGLAPVAPAFTMVRGPAPKTSDSARLFALINQALG